MCGGDNTGPRIRGVSNICGDHAESLLRSSFKRTCCKAQCWLTTSSHSFEAIRVFTLRPLSMAEVLDPGHFCPMQDSSVGLFKGLPISLTETSSELTESHGFSFIILLSSLYLSIDVTPVSQSEASTNSTWSLCPRLIYPWISSFKQSFMEP